MSKQMDVPPHGNAIYPWPAWTDGKGHTVKRGRHFQITAESFRRSLSVRAKAEGLSVTTRILDKKTVWFKFSTKE